MKKVLFIFLMLIGCAYAQDQNIGRRANKVIVLGRLAIDSVIVGVNPGDTVLYQAPDGTIRKYKISTISGGTGGGGIDSLVIRNYIFCVWKDGASDCTDLSRPYCFNGKNFNRTRDLYYNCRGELVDSSEIDFSNLYAGVGIKITDTLSDGKSFLLTATGTNGGSGVDSGAYHTVTTLSDTSYALCDLRGRCDTFLLTGASSGGGSQNWQQVTNNGNVTTRSVRANTYEVSGTSVTFNLDSAGKFINSGYGASIVFDRATGKLLLQPSFNSGSAGGSPTYTQGHLYMNPNGSITLGNYGGGFFNGTATRNLGVDAAGNVVEVATTNGSVSDTSLIGVLDSLNTPPGAPATGDRYLVGTSPTGAFAGHANATATWNGSSWSFVTPATGDLLLNAANYLVSKYNSTSWVRVGKYVIHNGGDPLPLAIGATTNDAVTMRTNNVVRQTWAANGSVSITALGTGTGFITANSGGLLAKTQWPNAALGYLTKYGTFGSLYDTVRNAISVTGGGGSYNATTGVISLTGGGTTNVDSTIRAKNVLGFASANAFGDSYAFGTGLASQGLAFFNVVATKYGFSLANYAQPGTGIAQMSWQNYKFNPAYNITKPTFMMYGFNDARSQLNPTRFYAKIENSTRAAIANQFLNGALAASDASLTKTGTWSTQDTWSLYGGKAKYITPGGLGEKTSTTGDQITYSTTADAIVIGFIGTVSTAGSFSVNVGSMTDTVNTAERTDGLAVIYDSTTATGLSCVKVYSGLGTASKTVTIKNLGGQIVIDYVGTLKTIRDSCAAFFATSIQKINPSGWDIGTGTFKGSNQLVELANARIKYVISEFNAINKNYPIYYVDINKYILPETDYQADSLHWNSSGHAKAALAYIDFLSRPLSTYGAIDQPQGTDFQLPGYVAKDALNNLNLSFGGLLKITSGSYNIAAGSRPLASNTTGVQNIAIGGSALLNNTIGNYNTVIGHASMLNNIDGNNNTAVGALSLNLHKRNGLNTSLGTQSLASDTSGAQNTAVGSSSMYNNTNGGLNTAIGESSMYSNKTGIWNSSMGVISLYSSVSGNYNTSIGTISLYNNTGNANTALGVEAGRSNTTGGNNTFVGYNAGYNANVGQVGNLTNSTALGSNAVTTVSNSMVYGNSAVTDQFFNGHINLTIGNKIKIPTGTNASAGTATLVAGTVTVSTTAAATASKIFVTVTTPGGTQGFLSVPTIVNGTSFTITSTSSAETSAVNWWIIN